VDKIIGLHTRNVR